MDQASAKERETEKSVAALVQKALASELPDHRVQTGRNLLYKIVVDPAGKVSHADDSIPARGQYAFQTDVLISRGEVPLVVIELKVKSFSSHDVLVYSAKASKHKSIYPYLRYGLVVVGSEGLGRRFLIHSENFDFGMAVPDAAAIRSDLVPLARRQIESAEKLVKLANSKRLKLHRYEQLVEVED